MGEHALNTPFARVVVAAQLLLVPARRLDGVRQQCPPTIAAPTVLFESGFRRCDSPPHRSSPKILTAV
jgi:hypothetical protein